MSIFLKNMMLFGFGKLPNGTIFAERDSTYVRYINLYRAFLCIFPKFFHSRSMVVTSCCGFILSTPKTNLPMDP